jgi:hypothetical protein
VVPAGRNAGTEKTAASAAQSLTHEQRRRAQLGS